MCLFYIEGLWCVTLISKRSWGLWSNISLLYKVTKWFLAAKYKTAFYCQLLWKLHVRIEKYLMYAVNPKVNISICVSNKPHRHSCETYEITFFFFFWESPRVVSFRRSQGDSRAALEFCPSFHMFSVLSLWNQSSLHRPDCLLASRHATNILLHYMWDWTIQNTENFLFPLPETHKFFVDFEGWFETWTHNTSFYSVICSSLGFNFKDTITG